jgi:integration host factor subunit beta
MMIKSELVDVMAGKESQLDRADIERAVNLLLERMSRVLAAGERIEIRGFGSFSLRFRRPRLGRNPKTGGAVFLPGKHVPRFKPGKLLRDRLNAARMP